MEAGPFPTVEIRILFLVKVGRLGDFQQES